MPDDKISEENSRCPTPAQSPRRVNRFDQNQNESVDRIKTAPPQQSTSKKPRKRWGQTQNVNLNETKDNPLGIDSVLVLKSPRNNNLMDNTIKDPELKALANQIDSIPYLKRDKSEPTHQKPKTA